MGLKKILLVDDEEGFHILNTRTLMQNNIQCTIDKVFDGAQALRYITACTEYPDFILLDINMPGMDGLMFIEAYQKLELPKSPVFVLSTSQLDSHRNTALSYSFVKGY